MLARIEHFFRRLRRQISRSEWAIRLLGLPVFKGTGTEPGLVLIQIDGLSRQQIERAIKRGRMPFLRRLVQREQYEMRTLYPGMPSSTPAVQAELYYGARCVVPAFSYFDRSLHQVITMFTADCAKDLEAKLRQQGEGLLRDGSSWSNIFSGGAAEEEAHFCAVSLGFHDLFRSRPLIRLVTFPVFHFISLLKIISLLVAEFFLATWDLFVGVSRGESFFEEFKAVFKRVFICTGLRELLTIGVKIDVARGLPIVHVNFVGYDEQAHRRGPASTFAHLSLLGIDGAIKSIYRASQRSARRDYQVWIFSDHGQEATIPFDKLHNSGLEEVISAALDGAEQKAVARQNPSRRPKRPRFTSERASSRSFVEWFRAEVLTLFEQKPFTVAAMGPVGHLYLKETVSLEKKRDIATHLVRKSHVPSALVCDNSDSAEWIHSQGSVSIPETTPDSLPHPGALKGEVTRDLVALCRNKLAGDLILLGWGPNAPSITFVNERGSHAGPGPEETQGFLLVPPLTRLPDAAAEFLRPSDLRAAILHFLGREALPSPAATRIRSSMRQLRVMTYNVHSCVGMDGRISPRRIASVIARYNPDVVALQELDLGRVRSQRSDQPRLIAEELGMHVAFCATVIKNDEKYGHALLSAYPMNVIRTDMLCSGPWSARIQPRGALWVCVEIQGLRLNLMNTHFGLRRSERLAQASDLLSRNWIGAINEDERIILCGDFNMFPSSPPYRFLTQRLRDVQGYTMEFQPLNTFSTLRPLVRIDHIFVSRHFVPTSVMVPRNHLTRVASDHLPLIADLNFQNGSHAG